MQVNSENSSYTQRKFLARAQAWTQEILSGKWIRVVVLLTWAHCYSVNGKNFQATVLLIFNT